jgi:hypothetical protein
LHQTPFQHRLWQIARNAHAAGDRADARILMRMIEAIDNDDYPALPQYFPALRQNYRDVLGKLPASRGKDEGASAGSAGE